MMNQGRAQLQREGARRSTRGTHVENNPVNSPSSIAKNISSSRLSSPVSSSSWNELENLPAMAKPSKATSCLPCQLLHARCDGASSQYCLRRANPLSVPPSEPGKAKRKRAERNPKPFSKPTKKQLSKPPPRTRKNAGVQLSLPIPVIPTTLTAFLVSPRRMLSVPPLDPSRCAPHLSSRKERLEMRIKVQNACSSLNSSS